MSSWRVTGTKRATDAVSSAGGPSKQPKKQKDDLVVALAKLTLQNTSAIQELQAAAFRTYLIPADLPAVSKSKDTVTEYIKVTKDEGPEHRRGPIHLHAAAGFFEGLVDAPKGDGDVDMVSKNITKWREDIEEMEFHEAMEELPVFRIGKTFKSDVKKLQIRISNKLVMMDVHDLLLRKGGKVKVGQPPKTELQRIIQRHLDKAE
mmetsp:Transcript_52144/g.148659  ORF Transcript_52144/g.148659 Transcript_52144/m.148659 type:complete len:205 (-) Transcript_52144:331-945(-)